MQTNLLLASALCLLFTIQVRSQVRSHSNAVGQRNQTAPQIRTAPNQNNVSTRSSQGVGVRFNQPHIRVPGRVTAGAASFGSAGVIVGGNAGGMINPNQGGIAPVVGGVPASANHSQAGQQPVSYPAYPTYGGAGAGGGGGGVVAPGGPHTQMVIQMQPGENLYIFPKSATVAAQRLRAQHEAAMRAAATESADAPADLNVVPTMNDSEPVPEPQPELPEIESETETELAIDSSAPQGLIDLEETGSETQDNSDENNPKKTERSNVVPISVLSGPLFSNDTLLEWQRQHAEKGNPQSQYAMGLRYLTGTGVEQNEDRARHWFEKASRQGELRARAKLRELSKRLES